MAETVIVEWTTAARDVLAERARQVTAEGWTSEHDDRQAPGELAGAAACYCPNDGAQMRGDVGLDWIIVGGESGKNARPMHPDWARSLRDQCQAAGVPFFFKQWGEYGPIPAESHPIEHCDRYGGVKSLTFTADGQQMVQFGKARAGRLLDGVEWSQMPGAQNG